MSNESEKDFLVEYNKQLDTIPDAKVYYTLRKYRVRFVSKRQIQIVKTILALYALGFRQFTTNLIRFCCHQVSAPTLLHTLHVLGDKHVLLMQRKDSRKQEFVWILVPAFLKAYEEVG